MKKKIFLDFDSTITDSVKAYCEVYNWLYNAHADYRKVNKWDLSDECLLAANYVEDIFASQEFFNVLEPMDNYTLEVINMLKKKYDVIICSIGTPENISRKAKWIEQKLDIKDMILLSQSNLKMDKSIIDMSGGIIIDDHADNLVTSNADIKICFGAIKAWNEDWSGIRTSDWGELGRMLL